MTSNKSCMFIYCPPSRIHMKKWNRYRNQLLVLSMSLYVFFSLSFLFSSFFPPFQIRKLEEEKKKNRSEQIVLEHHHHHHRRRQHSHHWYRFFLHITCPFDVFRCSIQQREKSFLLGSILFFVTKDISFLLLDFSLFWRLFC